MSPADKGVPEAGGKTQFVDSCNFLCIRRNVLSTSQQFDNKRNRFKHFQRVICNNC